MNVREVAGRMGAASIEKVNFQSEAKHVCFTGGTRAKMVSTKLMRASDNTMYAMCPDCRRFFYSVPGRHRTADERIKQFAYA